ncbi:hypothetical protein C5L31_001534 [Secundilactobacillus malefermentans]|uniref:Pyrroline-5-carboxylate reductase n=1 Tax=Secundilactobacillus malefermentans TaxID=176292 RepID=A0A4R5NNC3_9LACO|nr:pyrroline-5-carboxylate reductase [Secundilactobacillus malefermentans]KRM57435.1 pyrroline-5-carboxylate reductase [Secundilactobacillus malefermentans DSM 5705 = KCTC 3548]TDG76943.1 hypothetical protein C5L31_001534 [Secundilactobacillus malefermentans]
MKLGFIGVGGMAQAIIKGLLASKTVTNKDIFVHSAHQTYQKFASIANVTAVDSNTAVVKHSDVIVLSVTPNAAKPVLKEIREALEHQDKVLVSIVAGLTINQIEEMTNYNLPILRTLPNLNVQIGAGMTAVKASENLTGQQKQNIVGIFEAVGMTTEMPEDQFDTFSALAGSSPAYIYFFIDALSRAGVKHGLNKREATKIAAQATLGSAQMILKSDKVPFELVDQVSSPGGSTVAGLLAMEEAGFMTAVVKGIDATIERNNE